MELKEQIFRMYDVRGSFPEELSEPVAEYIGRAFGTVLIRKGLNSCVFGTDKKEISSSLSKSFVRGFLSTGCNATSVGNTADFVIRFLTCTQGFDSGAYIRTLSGGKKIGNIVLDYLGAEPVSASDIKYMYQLIKRDDFEYGSGKLYDEDLSKLYFEYLKHHFVFKGTLKVGIYIGYGINGEFLAQFLKQHGCVTEVMNASSENGIEEFQQLIIDKKCDIGFAYDTDYGKFVALDNTGTVFSVDKLLLLLSEYVLENKTGSGVVYDVKSTGVLKDFINSQGGIPKMTHPGRVYFMREMKKGAILGGEYKGNLYLANGYFGYSDNVFAACTLLEIMEKKESSLQKLMSFYPKYWTSDEIHVVCPEELKGDLLNTLASNLMKEGDLISVTNIEGVRAQVTKTGWFLVSGSEDDPLLDIRFEGEDAIEAKLVLERLKSALKAFEFLDIQTLDSIQINP